MPPGRKGSANRSSPTIRSRSGHAAPRDSSRTPRPTPKTPEVTAEAVSTPATPQCSQTISATHSSTRTTNWLTVTATKATDSTRACSSARGISVSGSSRTASTASRSRSARTSGAPFCRKQPQSGPAAAMTTPPPSRHAPTRISMVERKTRSRSSSDLLC